MSFDINNFQSNCIGKSGDIVVITTQDFNKSNYIKSDNQTIQLQETYELRLAEDWSDVTISAIEKIRKSK